MNIVTIKKRRKGSKGSHEFKGYYWLSKDGKNPAARESASGVKLLGSLNEAAAIATAERLFLKVFHAETLTVSRIDISDSTVIL